MIVITIKTDEKEIKCNFPEHASETTLAQFIDYADLAKNIEELKGDDVRYLRQLARMVSVFLNVDLEDILKIKFDSGLDAYDQDNIESSLLSLYANINRIITDYQPEIPTGEDYEFEYKGIDFVVPAFFRGITGEEIAPNLTVQEVVELAELKRVIKEGKGKAGDLKFTELLRQLAILAKHPGEKLPDDEDSVEQFILERSAFFQSISMKIALDVDFFLISSGR